jgi:DNA-binding transcriptional ArsR family regulator
MKATLTRQHHLLAAVGHASRYRLFLLLAQRERCVTELAAEVGLSQSCTTRHVQALAAAGAVVAKRDGKRVRVRLRLERAEVAGLLTWCVGAGAAADAALATATEAADPVRRARTAAPRARAATAPTAANPRVVAASAPAAAISGTNVAPEPDHAAAPVAPRPRPDRRDLEDFLL